ncbi:MAG: hypothetical protein ACP5IE_10190, partial [Infirmifilum sp.]
LRSTYDIVKDIPLLEVTTRSITGLEKDEKTINAVFVDGSILPGHLDPYLDYIRENSRIIPRKWVDFFIEIRNLLIHSYCQLYEKAMSEGIWLIGVVKNGMDKTISRALVTKAEGVNIPLMSDQDLMKYLLDSDSYIIYQPHKVVGSRSDVKDSISKFCNKVYPIYNIIYVPPELPIVHKPLQLTVLAPYKLDLADSEKTNEELRTILSIVRMFNIQDESHERSGNIPLTLQQLKLIDQQIRQEKSFVADIIARQLDLILNQLLGHVISKEDVQISGRFMAYTFDPLTHKKLIQSKEEDLITMFRKFARQLGEI